MTRTSTDPTLSLLSAGLAWLREGHAVAMATVVETWGSSPRGAGSHLLVRDDGAMEGSVSGGCVEGAVVTEARELLGGRGDAPAAGTLMEFGVTDDEAWAVGLACGGRVLVHVAPVQQALLEPLVEALAARETVLLALELEGPGRGMVRGPAPPGSGGGDALVEPLEGVPPPADDLAGAVTAAEVENAVEDDRPVRLGPGGALFLRPYLPPPRLVLVGGVHIAQEIVALAGPLGLDVRVVDPRRAFATPERFPGLEPGVDLEVAWPDAALEGRLDRRTAVVTLSHDPKIDDPALVRALGSEAFYVGALGSGRTHRRRLERLREEGLDDGTLERIHGPVGLDIGARSPGEIALSILAEVVRSLRRGDG